MGFKKPITSALKPGSGMCWTQPGVEYRPPHHIYSSVCMPEQPFLPREERGRGMAPGPECRTCWCSLSPGPGLCSAPLARWLRRPGTAHTAAPQQLLQGARLFSRSNFLQRKIFFSKEPKWGTSCCRLFIGNHCESSFATHQEGLSLSRLHPALCPQPSLPVHAQG